ncbi:hypothetical protein KM914_06700 [Virgibacillus pantothenticus]|uniref:hypothetical protein n=1 Tax=Virgibacillus pantothenticus TaxID=1473 RepID=UPI001BCF7D12|nr:hypothetical protein [Virgibacillus pantothenticus]MBU8566130.1 hypothetical protein [Virgibacillus pantothenticus]MBU8600574.1 hypothetical protein [Virgibacillus pantothenticus]MBU8634450.1 hypothetical protein [Virgibacillus pantothenticus]MBU8642713.1 hypothetical protein [Virgibacillus pantothenticus]MBU8647127.1 hypothetical protein [Virgibacillus pantothenticus]
MYTQCKPERAALDLTETVTGYKIDWHWIIKGKKIGTWNLTIKAFSIIPANNCQY